MQHAGRKDRHPAPLVVEEVHKAYGPTPVLQGLSLRLSRGEILGLLGANGAGKTTLLKLVAGLGMPDHGRITVAGRDTDSQAAAARQQVGVLFHQTHLYEDLTAEENLRFWSRMSGQTLDTAALSATLRPALNFYVSRSPLPQEPIGSPTVHSTPLRDLYLVLATFQEDGAAVTARVLLRPLVMWIWIGGGIMLAGALVALLPGRQGRRIRPGRKMVAARAETVASGE